MFPVNTDPYCLQAFGATPCYHRRLRRLAAGLLGCADATSSVWETVSQRNGLQVRRPKAANDGGGTGAKPHPSRSSTVRVTRIVLQYLLVSYTTYSDDALQYRPFNHRSVES